MIKFRNAAVAAATAVALTFAGTTVAAAEDNNSSSFSTSSQIGFERGAWDQGEDGKPVVKDENQISGHDGFGDEQAENQPQWFEDWKNIATVGAIGTVIGAIIGAVNWAKFNGLLPY